MRNARDTANSRVDVYVTDESSAVLKPFTHLQRRYLDFHRDKIFLSCGR